MKEIKLLEHKFNLCIEDPGLWVEDELGKCSLKNGKILLNKNLPKDVLSSTLLHEVTHMIADLNSIDLDEQVVDNLSLGYLSFIKNNRKLIEEMIY